MDIKSIGVIGSGLMGAGIVETCARTGYHVVVREINDEMLQAGLQRVEASMEKAVQRGKLASEARDAARGRVKGATDLADLAGSDLVIEAITENMALKKEIFAELDRLCPPHTILASNTSSLSITDLASATQPAELVVVLHFFNPLTVMPLL